MWTHKNKKKLLGILFIYWAGFNYLVLHAPISVFDVSGTTPYTQAQIVESDAIDPNSLAQENLSWKEIQLPDDWYHSGHLNNQVWYRFKVELDPDTTDHWAVYLPSVTHNAAVYVNRVWIGQGGRFSDPVSRHHNNPLIFEFSPDLLQAGSNTVDIKVKASFYKQGLFDQVYIAPAEVLREAHQWKRFWRVDFISWITLSMYLMGGIVLCFWLARPQDKIYGLFALQLFIWASHNLNLFIFDIPVSAHVWEAFTMSTLGWTVVAMIFFNHRYVGLQNKKVERFALFFAVMGLGIFFLPDINAILTIGYGVWDSFLIVFGSYAIIHLMRVFWRQPHIDYYLMLIVGIPILVFGFHDILTVNNFRDRRDGLTIQYSVIPAIMLFSFFLVRRFVQSINQAEAMAATLEQRVQDKEQELIQQYEQVKHLEKENVLSEERERIMRDMHDGIGGQLISVATMLQAYEGEAFQKVREKIQHSLTDLRFVIDSLDPMLNDLPTLLGMMRRRLSEQLEAANIQLHWDIHELPELQSLSPKRSLHIMRIVQEAIANTIKHAEANNVTLSTAYQEDHAYPIQISVIDDGNGMDADKSHHGERRGLKNMNYRAQQIDAAISINSSQNGTTVELAMKNQ